MSVQKRLRGRRAAPGWSGVGWATPYTGRHTYASVLIHGGPSPLAVALGHASAETT